MARLCSPNAGTAPILAVNVSELAGGNKAGTGPWGEVATALAAPACPRS